MTLRQPIRRSCSPPATASRPRARSTATRRWRPLLVGDDARRVHRVVDGLLAAPRVSGPSLGVGDAGLALAFAELARSRGDEAAAQAARACMDRAIDAMARDAMAPWLFDGFTGIAWVAHHLFGEGSAEIDAAVARVVHDRPAVHELLGGIAGLGLYALARPRAGLGGVVASLGKSALRDADGVTWETPISLVPAGSLPPGTRRHVNLGLAHGLPGVLGLLALSYDAAGGGPLGRGVAGAGPRSRRAAIAALLDDAVRWLLAHRLPDGAAAWFPGWIDPGVRPWLGRQGWCYGDAAIARVLWLAARAADEPDWRRIAIEGARRAALRPLPRAGDLDAGLCHGSAGLAHIFNHHWQDTGERVFADAARRWLDRALARLDRVAGDGLLSGRAGVALALLHAITAHEPTWDRVLLLS